MPKHGIIDSGISYVGGGGMAVVAKQVETTLTIVEIAQNTAIFFGCALVIVRFIYDAVRTYRYLMEKK